MRHDMFDHVHVVAFWLSHYLWEHNINSGTIMTGGLNSFWMYFSGGSTVT